MAIHNIEGVSCLVPQDFCELPFLNGILKHLSEKPFFGDYEFVVTDHLTPVPNPHPSMVVFYLSNEDHRIPEFANEVKQVFTPYPPKDGHPKVESIPLGPNGQVPQKPVTGIEQRKAGLFFSGRKINRRKSFLDAIQALEQEKPEIVDAQFTKGFQKGIAPEFYAQKLAEYAIVPAPEGNFSNITFRLFEAMRQGCVVLAPPLPDAWFFKKFPGITMHDWGKLPEIAQSLLKDLPRMEKIQEATLSYYQEFCCELAAAKYIARMLER